MPAGSLRKPALASPCRHRWCLPPPGPASPATPRCAAPCRPQLLLADLQRNDASFRANRSRYLESKDDNGSTPLVLAAARGHIGCVKLVRRRWRWRQRQGLALSSC